MDKVEQIQVLLRSLSLEELLKVNTYLSEHIGIEKQIQLLEARKNLING